MKIRYKLAFAGVLLAASLLGIFGIWSWFLRDYREWGGLLELLMVVCLPASLVVGPVALLLYARHQLRQLDRLYQQGMGRPGADQRMASPEAPAVVSTMVYLLWFLLVVMASGVIIIGLGIYAHSERAETAGRILGIGAFALLAIGRMWKGRLARSRLFVWLDSLLSGSAGRLKAIVALAFVVLAGVLFERRHRIPIYEDEARTRTSVLEHIPIGTALDSARLAIERSGFECEVLDKMRDPSPKSRRSLYCAKSGWGFVVYGTWRIFFWLDPVNRVKEVSVTYGVTGP